MNWLWISCSGVHITESGKVHIQIVVHCATVLFDARLNVIQVSIPAYKNKICQVNKKAVRQMLKGSPHGIKYILVKHHVIF